MIYGDFSYIQHYIFTIFGLFSHLMKIDQNEFVLVILYRFNTYLKQSKMWFIANFGEFSLNYAIKGEFIDFFCGMPQICAMKW